MRWRRMRQDLRLWLRRRGLILTNLGEAAWSRRWVKQSLVALGLLLLLTALHRADGGLLGPLNRTVQQGLSQPYDFKAAAQRVQQSPVWQSVRVAELVERLRQAIAVPVLAPSGGTPSGGGTPTGAAGGDAAVPALAPVASDGVPTSGLATAFLPPVPGAISRSFGHDTSSSQKNSLFQGLELETQPGASVRAAAGGTVVSIKTDTTYGQRITLDHGDGLQTIYAFKGEVIVKAQQRVAAGGVLGTADAAGSATKARVYFEVQVDGRAVDPSPFLTEEWGGS